MAETFDYHDFDPSENIRPALLDLGIPHDEEDVHYQETTQNKDFKGLNGLSYPTCRRYHNSYIPHSHSSNDHRPKQLLPATSSGTGADDPFAQPMVGRRLVGVDNDSRAQAGSLRFIIQENTISDSTRKVMEYITGAGSDGLDLPWPGHLYGLRSDVEKALLPTPHGAGVAYPIADYSDVLEGKKYPAVCILTALKDVPFMYQVWAYYMIWQLRDVTEGETELDHARTCKDMT